jgi:hypothetical protein
MYNRTTNQFAKDENLIYTAGMGLSPFQEGFYAFAEGIPVTFI